jgi:hypothetical protein
MVVLHWRPRMWRWRELKTWGLGVFQGRNSLDYTIKYKARKLFVNTAELFTLYSLIGMCVILYRSKP